MTAVVTKPATITATRVIRRVAKVGFGARRQHCGYWLEVTIDGWLTQRANIKRDTFDYLKDHGVEVVQEVTPTATPVQEKKP